MYRPHEPGVGGGQRHTLPTTASSSYMPNSFSSMFSTPQNQRSTSSSGAANSRSLPRKDVSAETITDAYVQFMLFCNPQFPLDVDTELLRTTFNSPPRSNDKHFDTYRLFELIRKFEAKEIKTWGQLALDLGVEAPDLSKGQSAQKVQQYSVRLKRWMRAMHIDAFFEYLLGKQNPYFTNVSSTDASLQVGRSGVPPEEDLALRALDPSFRPKRGRRRNSEVNQDANNEGPSSIEGGAEEGFAYSESPANPPPDQYNDPWSLTPQTYSWANRQAPQSTTPAAAPSSLMWSHGASPHPISAQPSSMVSQLEAALDANEVRSTVRKRRKHGPAVSSAWPSSAAPGTKPRGRPPANRNPMSPSATSALPQSTTTPPLDQPSPQTAVSGYQSPAKRTKLSLQVPLHQGPVVRLATPPSVYVNGTSHESLEDPPFPLETLKKALTSDLLRAEVEGRGRLNETEAKRLSEAIIHRLNLHENNTARITAASWLGLGGHLHIPTGTASSIGRNKKIKVNSNGETTYHISWTAVLGGCEGQFELLHLTLAEPSPKEDEYDARIRALTGARVPEDGEDDENVDWKSKYKVLDLEVRLAVGELQRLKGQVIDKVLDVLL
ncbi:hypothetical protein K470DRAFT_257112 [Piedraia hortae CBS 480.64]|uniref:ARS binding protein 2 n=1 Tax=Piedraia hortae CBS 480.64 TaxID=1314780 RepID=A0A6A7C166_9PEZI|nr:hypothetical protein K470DRAFT_257112 [Piedraia hortae CBS 480.64]